MKTTNKEKPKKSGFVFVGYKTDFEKQPTTTLRIMGKPISVFKRSDGTFFAREMSCKHQGADLSKSPVSGDVVTCARHGWKYELSTGKCINRDSPSLREHEVAVENNAVFVGLTPMSRAAPGW